MSAAERRRFLHAGGQLATSLLAINVPGVAGPPAHPDLLDLVASDIAALRLAESANGSASVIGATIRHADHLVRMLAGTGEGSPHRRRVAELTCDAAYLTGWCTLILDHPRAAIQWYRVAERAARMAGDVDRTAQMLLRQGLAMRLLDDSAAGLAVVARSGPLLGRATPTTRGYIEFHRATLLAVTGRERAAWRVLDQAVGAYAEAEPGEQPWLYWVRPHDQAEVQRSIGRVELAAGYGKAAYERLAPVLGTLPPERPRSTGELHFHLAKAALLMGEPRQAVDHITEAYRAYDSVGAPLSSGQVSRVQKQLVDRFGDEVGKDLGDLLRSRSTGGEDACRYRLARSYTGRRRQRLHQRDCSYLRRFETSLARGWPEGEGREPGELAEDPLIRARFDVCTRCMRG